MSFYSKEFINWIETHADEIDQYSGRKADELLHRIAAEGTFKVGVPEELGGTGGTYTDLIDVLTELGYYSLTAAFISWGHSTFIHNIITSDNDYGVKTWLPDLLTANRAGGTGLSNAVKYLSGIEQLNVTIIEEDGQYYLDGRLPWVTNVRSDKFSAVFAANYQDDPEHSIIVTIPSESGVERSDDLEFVSLQGSNTAALTFNKVPLNPDWILSDNAVDYIAKTRPFFLGFQFGLAFGLSERSLYEVSQTLGTNRSVLSDEYQNTLDELLRIKKDLYDGLNQEGYFVEKPRELFQLRIDIVDVVANSLLLELQSSGGRGYFKNSDSSFIRRWNEGAFLPIVTPSAVQLRHILNA